MRRLSTAAVPALALLLAGALTTAAAAQQSASHMILSVQYDARDRVMGYRIHHDRKQITYIAMLGPGDVGSYRCSLGADEVMEITEGAPGGTYFMGRDGHPCKLPIFQPEPAPANPWDVPTGGGPVHPCPTCPRG